MTQLLLRCTAVANASQVYRSFHLTVGRLGEVVKGRSIADTHKTFGTPTPLLFTFGSDIGQYSIHALSLSSSSFGPIQHKLWLKRLTRNSSFLLYSRDAVPIESLDAHLPLTDQ